MKQRVEVAWCQGVMPFTLLNLSGKSELIDATASTFTTALKFARQSKNKNKLLLNLDYSQPPQLLAVIP
ncbi:MAG TPA: hypothetical protein V6C46_07205, partial [Coleofasciculaceae cyanobacterium]